VASFDDGLAFPQSPDGFWVAEALLVMRAMIALGGSVLESLLQTWGKKGEEEMLA
jgi:hypothetical protein